MVEMSLEYLGDKRCQLTHKQSGTLILTDAPKDNMGKGESFSPTDLLTSSLVACMTTILANKLEPLGISLLGTKANFIKHMQMNPRKVSKIEIALQMGSFVPREREADILEICRSCPVYLSISGEIQVDIKLSWA